jgi:hypothetical protein
LCQLLPPPVTIGSRLARGVWRYAPSDGATLLGLAPLQFALNRKAHEVRTVLRLIQHNVDLLERPARETGRHDVEELTAAAHDPDIADINSTSN